PQDLVAMTIEGILSRMSVAGVVVPTRSGATARRLARLRLPVWITAAATGERTCQGLQLSYGIYPVKLEEVPKEWRHWARDWVASTSVPGDYLILHEGPSPGHPDVAQRMEVIDLRKPPG
ncbi:MAG TPA: pyruvate kinase alpha/beta domain-containing protein, partial [Candidatus Deferrimicrobiaceae bacterium]